MTQYEQDESGYIVFADSGYTIFKDGAINPIAYHYSEKWFPTYNKAISYAMSIVSKVSQLNERFDCSSVSVYEGGEELMDAFHSYLRNEVVFQWRNHKRPAKKSQVEISR